MNDDRAEEAHPTHGALRSFLVERGIHPRKRHGQNFLLDENLLAAITRDAGIEKGDHVLEIGCGPGLLTRHLARAGAHVFAVDLDERLLEVARELVEGSGSVTFLHGDALAGKHELSASLIDHLRDWSPYRLVANLPYAVATPLLLGLATFEQAPFEMIVLVQREAAERYASGPGRKAFGSASVRLQVRYRVELLRHVPPTVFWPRPKVDSAVVRFARIAPLEQEATIAWVDALAEAGFAQRRKRLVRNLAQRFTGIDWEARLRERGLERDVRAEDLTAESYVALARHVLAQEGPRPR